MSPIFTHIIITIKCKISYFTTLFTRLRRHFLHHISTENIPLRHHHHPSIHPVTLILFIADNFIPDFRNFNPSLAKLRRGFFVDLRGRHSVVQLRVLSFVVDFINPITVQYNRNWRCVTVTAAAPVNSHPVGVLALKGVHAKLLMRGGGGGVW